MKYFIVIQMSPGRCIISIQQFVASRLKSKQTALNKWIGSDFWQFGARASESNEWSYCLYIAWKKSNKKFKLLALRPAEHFTSFKALISYKTVLTILYFSNSDDCSEANPNWSFQRWLLWRPNKKESVTISNDISFHSHSSVWDTIESITFVNQF